MKLIDSIKRFIKYLPYVANTSKSSNINSYPDTENTTENTNFYVPPGHFYSPIPSLEYVRNNLNNIFKPLPRIIPGIDLRESQQMELLQFLEKEISMDLTRFL